MSSKTPMTPNDLFSDGMPELTAEQKSLALDDILAEFGSALQSPPPAEPEPSAPAARQEQKTEPPAEAAAPSLVIDGYDFSQFLSDDFGASQDDAAPPVQAPPAAEPSQAPAAQPAVEARPQDASASEAAAPSLVIDGVDFSEFLSDDFAPEAPSPAPVSCKPAQPREQQKKPAPKATKSASVPDENAPRPQIRRRKATPGGILLRIAAFAAVVATVVLRRSCRTASAAPALTMSAALSLTSLIWMKCSLPTRR